MIFRTFFSAVFQGIGFKLCSYLYIYEGEYILKQLASDVARVETFERKLLQGLYNPPDF